MGTNTLLHKVGLESFSSFVSLAAGFSLLLLGCSSSEPVLPDRAPVSQGALPELPVARGSLVLEAVNDPHSGKGSFNYEGHETVPVIHVFPGESLRVNYRNQMSIHSTEQCASGPCMNMSNLHFHGLHVFTGIASGRHNLDDGNAGRINPIPRLVSHASARRKLPASSRRYVGCSYHRRHRSLRSGSARHEGTHSYNARCRATLRVVTGGCASDAGSRDALTPARGPVTIASIRPAGGRSTCATVSGRRAGS